MNYLYVEKDIYNFNYEEQKVEKSNNIPNRDKDIIEHLLKRIKTLEDEVSKLQ